MSVDDVTQIGVIKDSIDALKDSMDMFNPNRNDVDELQDLEAKLDELIDYWDSMADALKSGSMTIEDAWDAVWQQDTANADDFEWELMKRGIEEAEGWC